MPTLSVGRRSFDASRFSRILDLLPRSSRSYPRTSRQRFRTSEGKPTASFVAFQESWSFLVRSSWTSLSGTRSGRVRWNCVVLDRHSLGIRQTHNVVHFSARGGKLVDKETVSPRRGSWLVYFSDWPSIQPTIQARQIRISEPARLARGTSRRLSIAVV